MREASLPYLSTKSRESVRQGHAKQDQHYKPDHGFYTVEIERHFVFQPKWHHAEGASALVLSYYYALRSLLQKRPDLRCCRKRCCHCGIVFLTHPCNWKRTDLRCPFGCREAYRRQESKRRSTAYYRTPGGQRKKSKLNEKRSERTAAAVVAPTSEAKVAFGSESGSCLRASILEHVRMVTSLIEDRLVSLAEVISMLERFWRQHRLGRMRRIDYIVRCLNQGPSG